MQLIIHLPKHIIDSIVNITEDIVGIDGDIYYAWNGELYAEKLSTGYSKQVNMIEAKSPDKMITEAHKVVSDSTDKTYIEQLIDCSNGMELDDPKEVIDKLMKYDTDDNSVESYSMSIMRMSIARDISYSYFDEGYEIECDMRDETFNLIEAISKQ